MTRVALSKLKAQLSKYIRLVKSGEEVQIEDRGIPVAKIIKLKPSAQKSGLRIIPATRSIEVLRNFKSPLKKPLNVDIVKLLREDRDKR